MYTMARLNEPTVSTDSLEILRRKFLRQNRDIARVNSTQCLKIRNLENECARLLSENLQLRSEILRLKTELEGSHAHRIADHALQIKEKMEAQLLEWGTMLAGLGHEPIPRNRSPRAAKKARIQRSSIGRARTSDWRRRETISSMQDLEAAALQEGRLPPLWENKTYPRETLSRDEILALCSEAEESTDSPELGPPPVSRFVDEDPVKLDLSTLTRLLKPALSEQDNSDLDDEKKRPIQHPKSSTKSTGPVDVMGEPIQQFDAESSTQAADAAKKSTTEAAAPQAVKPSLKRKSREEDEKENVPLARPPPVPTSVAVKKQLEKGVNEKAKPMNKPVKEPPSDKRDDLERTSNTTQRKPLGAKSSNGSLGTSKKSGKAPTGGRGGKATIPDEEQESDNDHLKPQKQSKPIEIISSIASEPVSYADIEPESLSAEPNLAMPDSPEPSAPVEGVNDTPPPLDITSKGETTRANRRARAAVSYAEPNLRDKMRRPNTKEIFDAVAGDGKTMRRTSQIQRDDLLSGPSSAAKSGAKSVPSRKDALSYRVSKDACQDADIMASPLAQKTTRTLTLEQLPTSTTTGRTKDKATIQDRNSDEATAKPVTKTMNQRLDQIAAQEAEVAKMFDEADVYEFTDSSYSSPKRNSDDATLEGKSRSAVGRPPRSRRMSSVTRDDLSAEETTQNKKTTGKQGGSRKRASMAAIKSARSDIENIQGDCSSIDGDSISTTEGEITTRNRRRTTML